MMLTIVLTVAAGAVAAAGVHALVRRALAGEATAVRMLLRRATPVIRARVRRLLRRAPRAAAAHDCDDLVQEVWAELLADDGRALRAYDESRGVTFEGYVGLLAERRAAKILRAARAQKRGGATFTVDEAHAARVPAADPDPQQSLVAADLAAALDAWLEAHLPERGLLVFRYIYTDGCHPDEVADALGVNRQVVYNWTHRIRQTARAFFEERAAALP